MDNDVDIVKPKSSKSNKQHHSYSNLIYKLSLLVIVLIAVAAVGFYLGVSYEKGHKSISTTANRSGYLGGGGGGFEHFGDRTIGEVTTVSPNSITVQPSFGSSQPKTYSITSSTTVTDQGQSSSESSIAVGETVLVSGSSSNSTQATSIDINPSFGGGGFGGSSQSGSSTSGSSDTTTNLN